MAMWFYQQVDGVTRWLRYEEATQKDMAWFVKTLNSLPYIYGRIVFPWDGQAAMEFTSQCGFRNVTKVWKRTSSVQSEIEKVRRGLRSSIIDGQLCAKGIECLRNYSRKWDDLKQVFSQKAEHDKWSHGGDAMRTGFEGELGRLMFAGQMGQAVKVITEFDARALPVGVS